MKARPFHLLTNPHVINRFIFGHRVVIYYILVTNKSQSFFNTFVGRTDCVPVDLVPRCHRDPGR